MEHAPHWNRMHDHELWAALSAGINPFIRVLGIEGNIYRSLTTSSREFLASKFMHHVQEPVLFCRDGSGPDKYYLGHPRHFVSGGGTILAMKEVEPVWFLHASVKGQTASVCLPPLPRKHTKIPRPPNAYILYRKDRHSMVKKGNPKLTNNEVSQILGRAWNAEPPEVRQNYKEMSEKIKKALLEKHPQYQYQPRKPSERKRRMRKRPQAADSSSTENAMATPESLPAGSESSMSPESTY